MGTKKKIQQKEEVVVKKKNKKRKKYDVEINSTLSKMLKDDDDFGILVHLTIFMTIFRIYLNYF